MGSELIISEGFVPGAIGEITQLHAQHYAKHWGFGLFFEAKVASELANFASRMTVPDLALVATDDNGVAASLIVDFHDPDSGPRGAHLRWFIAADRCRGTGVGRELMSRAMNHVDANANGRCWLTTFAGLAPARHLYESFSFKLAHEAEGEAWGTKVIEQEFRR